MNYTPHGFQLDLDPRTAGPAAKWGSLVLLSTGVFFSLTQRSVGFGRNDLAFLLPEILSGEVWRLATYPFVALSGFGLILGVFLFYLFARSFESTWGTRDFLRFAAVSAVGAAIIAVPLSVILNAIGLFQDTAVYAGTGAVIDALLMAFALNAPNAKVLFGFVLPMRAKSVIQVLIGVEILMGLVDGVARLSMTIGGLAMGYLLISGNWRPSRWRTLAKRRPPRRRGLYVVPPKEGRTLH